MQRQRHRTCLDLLSEIAAQRFGRHRAGHVRDPGPPRLPSRRSRHRTPPAQAFLAAISIPPGHAALRLPGDEIVGAGLGSQFDRQLRTLRLRDGLHHGHRRARWGCVASLLDAGGQAALVDTDHHAVGHRAGAVGEHQQLTGPNPTDRRRMESLVTVDDRGGAGSRDDVDVEQGRRHAISDR
jgi:hypothetical protein